MCFCECPNWLFHKWLCETVTRLPQKRVYSGLCNPGLTRVGFVLFCKLILGGPHYSTKHSNPVWYCFLAHVLENFMVYILTYMWGWTKSIPMPEPAWLSRPEIPFDCHMQKETFQHCEFQPPFSDPFRCWESAAEQDSCMMVAIPQEKPNSVTE